MMWRPRLLESELANMVTVVALFYVAAGQYSGAVWISAFNVALNGYPVMLQRVNRFRVAQIRARAIQRA